MVQNRVIKFSKQQNVYKQIGNYTSFIHIQQSGRDYFYDREAYPPRLGFLFFSITNVGILLLKWIDQNWKS